MFQLASPWILALIILPFLIYLLLPKAKLILPAALKIPFYQDLVCKINQENTKWSQVQTRGLFSGIWMLLLVAAAGPQWVGAPIPLAGEGRNIMMALDLSGSMQLNDMLFNGRPVSRLFVVKWAAEQFINQRVGDHLGLILFGSQAYLQTPLTYDRKSLLSRIQDATVGLAGQTTSIGDALGLAVKRFQNVPNKSRIIILLTDGANTSGVLTPLKAAELAKLDGIKVYTIGLGSEPSASLAAQGIFSVQNADLDEDTLKEIAKLTGGQYFRATDPKSLHEIYNTINSLEKVAQKKAVVRPKQEYYPWPLGLALFLLFFYFCRVAYVK
jgi:Ca-activated chloride channel family protein